MIEIIETVLGMYTLVFIGALTFSTYVDYKVSEIYKLDYKGQLGIVSYLLPILLFSVNEIIGGWVGIVGSLVILVVIIAVVIILVNIVGEGIEK